VTVDPGSAPVVGKFAPGGVLGIPQQATRSVLPVVPLVTGAGGNGVPAFRKGALLVPRILAGEALEWVGRFRIDLVNGRGWPAPPAEIEARRETVHLRHELVEVAVMHRRSFAEWLLNAAARPLEVRGAVWAVDLGALTLSVGSARYRLTDDSRRQVTLLV
jgi:hypothetical protein